MFYPSILVTGANGFIGQSVCKYFAKKNYLVVALLREIHLSTDISNYSNIFVESFCDFNSKVAECFTKYKPSIVIHCAGSSSVFNSFQNPIVDFESTINTVLSSLENMRNIIPNSQFIFISSASVYGNPNTIPIRETHNTNPISPYGYHKLMAEQLVSEYSQFFKINSLILRIFSAYGNYENIGLKKQIIFDLFHKFHTASSNQIELFGTGNETRDFIHIYDILLTIEMLLQKKANGIFNLASGKQTSIKELAILIQQIISSEKQFLFTNENRSGDPLYWEADVSKLKQLNIESTVSLNIGLLNFYKWYYQNFYKY